MPGEVRPRRRHDKVPTERVPEALWFDTVVYDAVALRRLVERVGASQVVVGTDYPFDMGCYDVHGLVASAGLSEADRAAVLGGNAARLIGWPTQVES